MKGHVIRWWGIIPGGGRIPRERSMPGRHWGWDATCSCGWDSRTGGAIQERVREYVQEHLRSVHVMSTAYVHLTQEEISVLLEGLGAVEWWGTKHEIVVALRRKLKEAL